MTEICFVRHGETDWNNQQRIQGATDIPLNETGRRQARAVAEHLSAEDWDIIFSSPLIRAYDTAMSIAREVDIDTVQTDDRLRERSFGRAEGIHVDRYRAEYRGRSITGIEPWESVGERALAAATDMVADWPGRRIIAVAHGGLIASLLNIVSGGAIGTGYPPLQNTCMNLFAYDRGEWRIEWYNRVAPELETIPE